MKDQQFISLLFGKKKSVFKTVTTNEEHWFTQDNQFTVETKQ